MKLTLTAAALSSAVAGRPLINCVGYRPDEYAGTGTKALFSTLQMGQCLTAGDAICSSTGSWVFGIDPTDRMIKLWRGNNVR